ncbi:MAG: NAD+ synthase [Chloroflexi bacterium]|nr:NAD+ synthase [Chloroflexota bacterium]
MRHTRRVDASTGPNPEDPTVTPPLRIALAQINATVGDIDGNTRRILDAMRAAEEAGAELVAFPELALTGYPPEDLLLKPAFISANLRALDQIARASRDCVAIVGFVDRQDDIFNAAAVLHGGRVVARYHKQYLPNYGVFDEDRYFRRGIEAPVFRLGEITIGVNICEDIWYAVGPTNAQSLAGAELIVNINASPFSDEKRSYRRKMLATRAGDNQVAVAYVNLVGGQDELVFDGASMVFAPSGDMLCHGKAFAEDLVIVDVDVAGVFRARLHDPRRRKAHLGQPVTRSEPIVIAERRTVPERAPRAVCMADVEISRVEEIYRALVLGVRDYMHKNGFTRAVLGLSGGIDSSLVAAVAADAIGAENVLGVSMPSRYSSQHSKDDARDLAEALGMEYRVVPIERGFQGLLDTMAETFAGLKEDVTEENMQARVRGQILMAISNKLGHLVLTTGNKSEVATGYATLYGDMAGGFAVIKDVPKMLVYALCRHRNAVGARPVIPESVLTKPPSAELRPDQTDQDSLPPYEVLDAILEAYVEDDRPIQEIVACGQFDVEVVRQVIGLVDRAEYKRRQAAPGIKVTPRAFGRDRRLPITNRFRE